MKLAKRIDRIAPSATMAMDALAKEMRAQGVDVIGFGVGEPDFDTPENVKDAGIRAIQDGYTKYTPAGGTPELKEAVCTQLRQRHNLSYSTDEVMINVGAKHGLFNAFQALLDPGDEVIVPSPYWVSYVDQVRLTGAEAVIVPTQASNGFKMTPEQFREAITPRTRALVMNSPNNPTGAVYSKEELTAIASIAIEQNVFIISDEIYEPFVYTDAGHTPIPTLSEEMRNNCLLIHGVSKSHAMTGWRIGYAAGPKKLIRAMTSIQSHSTSNPTSIAQMAAIEALLGSDKPVQQMVEEFAKRRTYLVNRLRELSGIQCPLPDGAFYAFPDISSAFGKQYNGKVIENSSDFATILLEEAHVALVPGSAFGHEGHVRLSYATSMDNLEKGMDRIAEFWNALEA